jgi:hypothetical protein
MNKPWLYRCSNGHLMLVTLARGEGRPPITRDCDQTMPTWRPERGRIEVDCTARMVRRSWLERDFVLRRQGGMIAA